MKNTTLSPSQERRYKKLKDEIVAAVKSLSLNQARIDFLVEQLYDINKRLIGCEGRLLRLAESHRVSRDEFLKEYPGSELDPQLDPPHLESLRPRLEGFRRPREGQDQGDPPPDPGARHRDRP